MDAPAEDDCCHSDCKNCVLDIYQRQLTSQVQKSSNSVNLVLSQIRYKPFKIVQMQETTSSAKVYSLSPEEYDGKDRFFFKPGEHVVLRNSPSLEQEHLSRPYTLIPWDSGDSTFSVVIKLYTSGRMSEFISRWKIGDTTYWRGPYGDFTYEPNTYSNLIMICIGVGIAPMYALSKHITDDENDETFIHLLYGSSSPEEIILRREIAQLTSFWNFQCCHFLSRGFHDEQKRFNEHFVQGRLQKDQVEKVLDGLDARKVLVLVCGTDRFNEDMVNVLSAKGLQGKHVYVFS